MIFFYFALFWWFLSHPIRECINRVCEAGGLKTSKKRRCDKRIQQAFSDAPNMEMAGTNAILRVSSKFLSLVGLESNETIAKHDMPRISFASGGDSVSICYHLLKQHVKHMICLMILIGLCRKHWISLRTLRRMHKTGALAMCSNVAVVKRLI